MIHLHVFDKMKKIVLLCIMCGLIIVSGCDINLHFMDVDNQNTKDDLKNLIWNWNIPKIDTDDIIPDSLSWARDTAKWYANKYYEDSIEWLVDQAKEWLSGAKETLKWYYNSWVDELNWIISETINWAISWELNKFKIK